MTRHYDGILFVWFFLFSLVVLSAAVFSDSDAAEELFEHKDEVQVIVFLKGDPAPDLSSVQTMQEKKELLEERKEEVQKMQAKAFDVLDIPPESDKSMSTSEEDMSLEEDIVVEHSFSVFNGFVANVTEEGLEKLVDSELVEQVYEVKPIELLLTGSVPLINANDVWNFSVTGYNITGENEAVCVIDTGVNYSHQVFGACSNDTFLAGNCTKVISGYDYGNDDTDPMDHNSHGTHVAGITASNDSTYKGVAIGAKIVALKVFTDAGAGSTAAAISAIDWCVSNSSRFNISVITMSLAVTTGSGAEIFHASSCDTADMSGLARTASQAAASGIFVSAAAGNTGNSSGITSPACGENVTSVGSVTKSDAISGYNAAVILDLLAPGSSITSAILSGFGSKSGTSMATPHVAGAAAVLTQYWKKVYGITPKPDEITWRLKVRGVKINDTRNSIIFPRVDVLAALQPIINFTPTSIANASAVRNVSVLINMTSDANLSGGVLEWSYNNGSRMNYTMTKFNGTYFHVTITHLSSGTDTYLVYGNDSINTIGTSAVRTLIIDTQAPLVIITNPANGSSFAGVVQSFNATVAESTSDAVLFSFTNVSGTPFNVTLSNRSGNWNTNVNLSAFEEGLQGMTVLANDSAGNYNRSVLVEFTVDKTNPTITVVVPLAQRNFSLFSSNQTFNLTVRDNLLSLSQVLFSFDNASGAGFNVTAVNQSGHWVASYNVSLLAEGNHTVTVLSNDSVNNRNDTELVSFVVDGTAPAVEITSPASGSMFTFLSFNRTFNATVTDALLELQRVLFSFDNASGAGFNVTALNYSGIWVVSYNTSVLASGSHLVTVLANDSAGNVNFTAQVSFTVDITSPIVTLNSPSTVFNSSSSSVVFNCSVQDNAVLANITLFGNWSNGWHANSSVTITGSSNSTTFTLTLADGSYLWNCLAYDTDGNSAYAGANFTVGVDTTVPVISALSSGSISSSGATIIWTTSEMANASVSYGTTLALGSSATSTSWTTSQSNGLSGLSASTTYFYNVTSCDVVGNCQVNGTFNLTTSAAGSSSSSSSGGGGGGGGGSSKAAAATVSSAETSSASGSSPTQGVATESSGESGVGGGSILQVTEPVMASQQTVPSSERVSQKVSLLKGKKKVIGFDNDKIWITELEIETDVDRDVVVDVVYYPEKPMEVMVLNDTYQYLQVVAGLKESEVEEAALTFRVPVSWVEEHGYRERAVGLYVYSVGKWKELETEMVSKTTAEVVYRAEIEEMNYFAIAASTTVNKGSWLSQFAPTNMGVKGYVLVGVGVLILVLAITYFLVREKEN